jgi:hypothetical protein
MDYFQAFSPVAPHIEGRIKVWPLMRFFPLVLHLGR